ncbi:MAG: J domain-containing protein [Anaerolineales bacterium]
MYDLFGNPTTQSKCSVTEKNGALEIRTPYNPQFVALIKSLPSSARRFDSASKAWQVDTQYADKVREWILECYGEDVGTINISSSKSQLEMRVCDVWYLGRAKPAGDESQAMGMNARREWVFVFPERVLREWFEGDSRYTNTATLYGVLGIHRTADDEEIKSAYRRMVKQWHPDVCKEPNAQEMFIKIREAYELLSNPTRRAKYDAGLVLEATVSKDHVSSGYYRAPLRCGYILAEGYERLGRFIVAKILKWEDIVSDQGVLVASWPTWATEPTFSWR